jgi:hypothetical protein
MNLTEMTGSTFLWITPPIANTELPMPDPDAFDVTLHF